MLVDIAVTFPVPKRLIIRALINEDVNVPANKIVVIILPNSKGKLNSLYIAGHAVPNNESGNPSPIKAIYIKNSQIIQKPQFVSKFQLLFLLLTLYNKIR